MLMSIAIVVLAVYILAMLMLFAAFRMSATLEQRTLQPEPVKVVETYRRLH